MCLIEMFAQNETFHCPKRNPTCFIWYWIRRDLNVIRSLAEFALL